MKTIKLSAAFVLVCLMLVVFFPGKATAGSSDSTKNSYGQGNSYGNGNSATTTTTTDNSSNGNGGVGNDNGTGNQTHYPINGGIVFLTIAGVLIGLKVVLNKTKKLQPQPQEA